jgi:hypothetical protein
MRRKYHTIAIMGGRPMKRAMILLAIGCACGGTTTSGDASTDASSDATGCGPGRIMCGGACINPDNDPNNCGACGTKCTGNTPFCDGTCKAAPCFPDAGACASPGFCCGSNCCTSAQLCCKDEGPVGNPYGPSCFTPTAQQPTCLQGCAPLCKSDRNLKQGIVPVDNRAVLETLATVPISTWSYKSDPKTLHIGPMAQDLHAAFGVGSDHGYDPIDAHGIELSSIQALYEIVQEQNARIEKLERQLDRCPRP